MPLRSQIYRTPSRSQTHRETILSLSSNIQKSASKTTPFKLNACVNPVGRPKGSQKQKATSFRPPKVKRKLINKLSSMKIKRSCLTTTTTVTTTTTSKTTTLSSTNRDQLDNTLSEIDEISNNTKST